MQVRKLCNFVNSREDQLGWREIQYSSIENAFSYVIGLNWKKLNLKNILLTVKLDSTAVQITC